MRIGLFTDTYYPQINGVATSVYLLKKYLESLGNEVFVCTTTDPKSDQDELRVYRTRSMPFVSERRVGSFYSQRLAQLAADHHPDIIHTHTEFPLGIFGRSLAHSFHVPHVHTYHTIYEDYTHFVVKFGSLDTVAKAMTRLMSRSFCNSANEIVVPTEKVKTLLESYRVIRPIHVIPTGIELGKFEPSKYSREDIAACREELGLNPDQFVFLNIGRVSEEKKLDELIRYITEPLRQHENWVFLMIGNGPELEEYQAMVRDLDLQDRILFAGARPWADIGKYYQVGDVFVSASQSETQGLTYIEAMAAGLPVIARRDPCLDKVLLDGENGYMFESQPEFARRAEMLAENLALHRQFSQRAREQAALYSAQVFAQNMQELYFDVIHRFKDNAHSEFPIF